MNTHQLIERFGLADTDPEKWSALADTLLNLIADYRALNEIVGPHEANRALRRFTDFVHPPRRSRSSTDPRYNAALRRAYRTAKHGRKIEAVRNVMRRYGRAVTSSSLESTLRQVRRLLKRPTVGEVMYATRDEVIDPESAKPDK